MTNYEWLVKNDKLGDFIRTLYEHDWATIHEEYDVPNCLCIADWLQQEYQAPSVYHIVNADESCEQDKAEPYAPSQIYEFIVEGSGIDYSIYQIKAKSMKDALINYCKYDECLKNAEFKAVEKLDVSDALDLVNNALYSEIVEIHTMDVELFNNEKNYITRIDDEE